MTIHTTSASTQNAQNPDRNNLPAYKYASFSPRNRDKAIKADRLIACANQPAKPEIIPVANPSTHPMTAGQRIRLAEYMADYQAGVAA